MKHMKKLIALLLCLAMFISVLPLSVFAAEGTATGDFTGSTSVVDGLVVMSDLHVGTSGTTESSKQSRLESVLTQIKNAGVPVSSVNSAGDMFSSNESVVSGTVSKITGWVRNVFSGVATNYVWTDHDRGADVAKDSSLITYSNYYVFLLSMADTTHKERYGVKAYTADEVNQHIEAFETAVADLDKSKPLFIVAHQPLLDKRDDNGYAYVWATAINKVAEEMDVVYFYGHNHNYDSSAYYYYGKGDTMAVPNTSLVNTNITLNFTHVNAGYMYPSTANSSTRSGTAMAVTIYGDKINITTYDSNGVYTGSNKLNVDVSRQHAKNGIPQKLAVTSKIDYAVGDSIIAPSSVNVTYLKQDNSTYTDAVTSGYTLSEIRKGATTYTVDGFTFPEAGEYTLTYTCTLGNYQAQAQLVVTAEEVVSEKTVTAFDESNFVSVTATALGLKGITVTNLSGDVAAADKLFSDYVAVDVALQGHTAGNSIKYAIALVEGMDVDQLALYYIAEDGTATVLPMSVATAGNGQQYVEFTTTYVGTFAYGVRAVPDGYTLHSLTLENIPTNLFVGNGLDITNAVITATYTKAGAEDFVRKLSIYDYDESNFSGYDVNKTGAQTAVFTYEGLTATLDVYVWDRSFTNEELDVTIAVGEGEFGVNDANVEVLDNETVAADIQHVIAGNTYVVYDIELEYAEGFSATGTYKTVTVPVPAGVKNPVVYYVPGNGQPVVWINNATVNDDGTITFSTNHFSTYVVGEDTNITVEDPKTVTVGSTETTYTTETVTVYKLVTTPAAGKQYLIVNSNTGTGYGLDGDRNGYSTSAFTGGTGYYTNWDSTTNTGTAFDKGNDVYLTTSGAYLWTVSTSGSTYTFSNGNTRLGIGSSSTNRLVFNSSSSWTYSSSALRATRSNRTYYLYCSNGSWNASNTTRSDNVYFYEPVELTKVTTSTVDTTVEYSLAGVPDTITQVAIAGNALDLKAVLTAAPNSGNATTTDVSTAATTTYEIAGDPLNVISKLEGNKVTLTGTAGKALVKVSHTFTVNGEQKLVTNYITVSAINPHHFSIQLHENNGGEITENVVLKDIKAGDIFSVWAIVKAYTSDTDTTGIDLGTLGDALTWSVSDESIATINKETGVLTFTGYHFGTFDVTVSYTASGVTYTDTITISASDSHYVVPGDSTSDFPEYPNQGAIRFDKNATAVGNFSETGVSQLELSMTGIPYGKGVDVVVVIDTSSSMKRDKNGDEQSSYTSPNARYQIMRESLRDMLNVFDGANVDLAIVDFNGYSSSNNSSNTTNFIPGSNVVGNSNTDRTGANKGKIYTGVNANKYITSGTGSNIGGISNLGADDFENTAADAFDEARINQIYNYFTTGSSGTNYDFGMEAAYNLLAAKKEANEAAGKPRDQYVIFLTDGAPFRYNGFTANNQDGRNEMDKLLSGDYTPAELKTAFNWMSAEVLEMYNPVNGTHPHRMAEAIKGDPNQTYEVVLSTAVKDTDGDYLYTRQGLGAKFYAIGFCIADDVYSNANDIVKEATSHEVIRTLSSGEGYYYEDVEDKDTLSQAFVNIATTIAEAATDIVVTDKISQQYTMIFGVPKSTLDDEKASARNEAVAAALANRELYIELVNYTLDASHERTGTPETITRIYLKDSNGDAAGGIYSAAIKNANGNLEDAPTLTFAAPESDQKAYWAEVGNGNAGENDIVVQVGGKYYKFMPNGDGTLNVVSGAYAYGTIDEKSNMSTDAILITPYFAYSAKTKILAWTLDKVEEFKEIALRYFLYLDDSSTEIGTDKEVDAGTYTTNEWANMTYTNHLGNECRQEFPVPKMTWNGAQVSYVFYLVNSAGQPINKAGEVVDFANAVFVTDVYTKAVVWNDTDTPTMEGTAYLDANWMAQEKMPAGYTLFDQQAYYELKVYEDHEGNILDNYFIIAGGEANGATGSTTKVYNTKAGQKISAYGKYTKDTAATEDFDFANTTVAFAIVWEQKLITDTVVVDFGLDVVINVVQNDLLDNVLSGISKYPNSSVDLNTGSSDSSTFVNQEVTSDGYTFTVDGETSIRFHQTNMQFNAPVTIYYESAVKRYVSGKYETDYMYSSLTVIPATTIYYEDSFISESDLKTYEWGTDDWKAPTTGLGSGEFSWKLEGSAQDKTQSQDRPGASQISAALDADNKYGYDGAYANMSKYSLGSALKVHVDYDHMATASFSFYGTGFDLISMTSNTTGTIIVNVYDSTDAQVKSFVVNTYYGYKYENGEWIVTSSADPNALYQVPVMKIEGLDYGKYTAEIKAVYDPIFDQGLYSNASYDFYLDAIRIYDPTGNQNGTANDAYKADGEGWPLYKELRNLIISAPDGFGSDITVESEGNFATTEVGGAVFIDGIAGNTVIANYESFGPNNELYLAPGQSVAFQIADAFVNAKGDVDPVDVQLAVKSVGGAGALEIFNPGIKKTVETKTEGDQTVVTTTYSASKDNLLKLQPGATDLYYSIKKLAGGTIVIANPANSTAIISITNLKFTFGEAATVKTETGVNENGETVETEVSVLSISEEAVVYAMRSLSGHSTSSTVYYDNPAPTPDATTPNGNAPEDNTTEDNTTEDNTSGDNTTDDNTSEDNTSDDNTSEDNTTDDDTTDDDTTEEEESDKDETTEPEEELGWFARILRAIGNFFRKIFGWIFN